MEKEKKKQKKLEEKKLEKKRKAEELRKLAAERKLARVPARSARRGACWRLDLRAASASSLRPLRRHRRWQLPPPA